MHATAPATAGALVCAKQCCCCSDVYVFRCFRALNGLQAERLQWETEREGIIEELASAREAQSSSQELQAAVEAMKQCESKLSASEAEVKRLSDVLASSTVTVQATAQENSLLKESLQMLQEKEGDSTRAVLILEERCRGLSQQVSLTVKRVVLMYFPHAPLCLCADCGTVK